MEPNCAGEEACYHRTIVVHGGAAVHLGPRGWGSAGGGEGVGEATVMDGEVRSSGGSRSSAGRCAGRA